MSCLIITKDSTTTITLPGDWPGLQNLRSIELGSHKRRDKSSLPVFSGSHILWDVNEIVKNNVTRNLLNEE